MQKYIKKEREKIKSSSSSPLFTSLTEQNDRGGGAHFSGENVVEIFISWDLWLCPPWFLHLAGLTNG